MAGSPDELIRQDVPDWPASDDVGAPDRSGRAIAGDRRLVEVDRFAIHLTEVVAVVADLCADAHLEYLHGGRGRENHRHGVVLIVGCMQFDAMVRIEVPSGRIIIAHVHADKLARGVVDVEGADQPRCIKAVVEAPLHGAESKGHAGYVNVVAEVDLVVCELDEVGIAIVVHSIRAINRTTTNARLIGGRAGLIAGRVFR